MHAIDQFMDGIERNRSGQGGAAVSVCSAHPDVLRATFRTALAHDTFALIESTSNQVDQYGGYTGMRPGDFVGLVHGLAKEEGFPTERILLGGDHLGTNTWSGGPAEAALNEARVLVQAYVRAGYKKIHLDASFVCADDRSPLSDETVARRCAAMARVCETHAKGKPPVYIIGTEVPTPGGAHDEEVLHITTARDVETTLEVFKAVFLENGLQEAWDRVVGLVVQPGIEFSDHGVHDFQPVPELAAAILPYKGMIYEAHSTDYQTAFGLRGLVDHHFYVLKVGPWLTFTLREGLYLLEFMEKELSVAAPSAFRETLLQTMRADPVHWKKYYSGKPEEIEFKLNYSYSDRSRYYLPAAEVLASQKRLFQNLQELPEPLISQFMPGQYARLRSGKLAKDTRSLLIDRISNVLELYMAAAPSRYCKTPP